MIQLAVSNIAWPAGLRAEALGILTESAITGVEVAPTMEWPDWQITSSQGRAYRQDLAEQGFTISSLQSILFGKPGARLFADAEAQRELTEHLDFCARLAQDFGATPLVFGAPKNRLRGALSSEAAFDQAVAVFRQAAPEFAQRNACLCLEANPSEYACDFMTGAAQAAHVVRAVGHPGVGLHLDTACMYLAGDCPETIIKEYAGILRHVHVSEPFLGTFDAPVAHHLATARALRDAGYRGWVVLEMRATPEPLTDLRRAVQFLAATYGSASG